MDSDRAYRRITRAGMGPCTYKLTEEEDARLRDLYTHAPMEKVEVDESLIRKGWAIFAEDMQAVYPAWVRNVFFRHNGSRHSYIKIVD
jgi:hypothetical protein